MDSRPHPPSSAPQQSCPRGAGDWGDRGCWGGQVSGTCRKPSSCCSRKQRGCGFLALHGMGLGGWRWRASAPWPHGLRPPGPHPTAVWLLVPWSPSQGPPQPLVPIPQPCGSSSLGVHPKAPPAPHPVFLAPLPHSPRLPDLQPPWPKFLWPPWTASPHPQLEITLTIFGAPLRGWRAGTDAGTERCGGCRHPWGGRRRTPVSCPPPASRAPTGAGIRACGPARPCSALSAFQLCPRCAARKVRGGWGGGAGQFG